MIESMLLTQLQLRFFLDALGIKCQFGGDEWKCGGPDFPYAREILTAMRIPQTDQEKVLEIFKENGGYCDCEILMNAAFNLLGEEPPY